MDDFLSWLGVVALTALIMIPVAHLIIKIIEAHTFWQVNPPC